MIEDTPNAPEGFEPEKAIEYELEPVLSDADAIEAAATAYAVVSALSDLFIEKTKRR